MTIVLREDLLTIPAEQRQPTPRKTSEDLLQGRRRLIIEHDGAEYTLHLTRQNKLLLTK